MAVRRREGPTKADKSASAIAVADKENEVSQVATGSGSEGRPHKKEKAAGSRQGFFDVYKPGQGFNTRVWSAVGAGAMVIWFAFFLYEKLGTVATDPRMVRLWQVGVWVAVLLIFGLLGYWVLALNRKVCDFMIATEGEMKKVNWSTRKDIIGSTKVVVIMVLFMGSLLFAVDLFFMTFFNSIGVLKGQGFLETLRELF
jgi:preprotein translocase SecE subunit